MDSNSKPLIGKDVIESLTIGMYEDSRFIFREYIQNSADQIDKAYRENLLKENEGDIYIHIDAAKKEISIEDNATGISSQYVVSILQNIAQSTKQRGVDKGFRGIGRLGGLAYCSKLIFETSYKNEATKSIMTWDANLLKTIINDRSTKDEAAAVIQKVTTFVTEQTDAEAHYFKVVLQGVTNPDLLDVKDVRNYLSMVAPVPFENHFIFRSKIYDRLKEESIQLDEYRIFINSEQLFKGYTSLIYEGEEGNKRRVDELFDIVFFKENDKQGNLLYWGWYGLSTFQNKQLNSINKARGFRLRKSNIQVGDEFTMVRFHREQRGNFYFMGEVYGIHQDLIPNSRRDYFTENEICLLFETKIKHFFYTQLHKLYYAASEINSAVKKIEEFQMFRDELEQKQQQGFADKKEHQDYIDKLEKKKEEAQKAEGRIQKLQDANGEDKALPVKRILDKVSATRNLNVDTYDVSVNAGKLKFRADNLSKLNKEERKFLGRIYSIIRDVLNGDTAEELIKKIEDDLK